MIQFTPQNITIGIIIITVLISLKGFKDQVFLNRYLFNISGIKSAKQYERFFTCGFLHADLAHLGFNMYALFIFAPLVIVQLGVLPFFIIYFLAILGGSALSYFMHKTQYSYSALGASGGVTGIVLASVVVDPSIELGLLFIPFFIPGYIFAVLYLAYSIYAMQKESDNIGHDAHLGGAIVGLVVPLFLYPILLKENLMEIGIILLPIIYLGFYLFKKSK